MARPVPPRTGLILIDHGSKLAEANRLLQPIAESVRAKSTYSIVEIAHMELAAPTLADAFTRCARSGASEVVIVPYFLASGNHATGDIPRMASEAAAKVKKEFPNLHWKLGQPLGFDERIVDVVLDRAAQAEPQD